MELSTRNIQTHNTICHSDMQITLEDDFNVADTKPDIDQLIKTQGEVQITNATAEEGKVILRGKLSFSLLYITSEDIRPVHNIKGQIPFEESINTEHITPGKEVDCHFDLDDCQASLINSRKVSIRAIVSFHCCQKEERSILTGTDILSSEASRADMESFPAPEGLYKQFDTFEMTQLVTHKKDILRIKDESILPKGKPNIDTVLYYELTPQNLQNRVIDEGIRLLGDVHLFVLYIPENQERRLEYIETEIPFDNIISCENCYDDLILDIELLSSTNSLETKPDEDGEHRIFDFELNLNLAINFYDNSTVSYLKDAYSTACTLDLQREDISLSRLLMKNEAVVRVSDHLRITQENDTISQICTASGSVQIDEQEIVEDGIAIEGVATLEVLYITENEEHPLAVATGTIPFSHLIEIPDISVDDSYELQASINQISALMLDNQEIDVKVIVNLSTLVFTYDSQNIINGITEMPKDLKKLQEMPGLVGFIVEQNGSLWDIAKEYNTTVDSIMLLNHIETDEVKAGDKLLLVKEISGF